MSLTNKDIKIGDILVHLDYPDWFEQVVHINHSTIEDFEGKTLNLPEKYKKTFKVGTIATIQTGQFRKCNEVEILLYL